MACLPCKVDPFCLVVLFLCLFSFEGAGATPATGYQVRGLTRVQKKKAYGKFHRRSHFLEQENRKNPFILPDQLAATLSWNPDIGEYLVDVFVGTPPKRFSLILDTGSDLTWIKCSPCQDRVAGMEQFFDPGSSTSFRNISRHDLRCSLIEPPGPGSVSCHGGELSQTCPYFYWYGARDQSSSTIGDLAAETFGLNLSPGSELVEVENVTFGCGRCNRGDTFNVASGVLGLGGGPLSFASQLRSRYGHTFSYCLPNTNTNRNTTSKLVFSANEDFLKRPGLNSTSFVTGKPNLDPTFYHVQIRSILVGGEPLDIPQETWEISPEGFGGTIIDSGSTISFFRDPAYRIIKEAFIEKVREHPIVEDDEDVLSPCYNVSGGELEKLEIPELGIVFGDGAVWNFPVENYFMPFGDIVCLAIRGIDEPRFSIIGNYQQQNFPIHFDKEDKLGFELKQCVDI